jgi:hypothetical protein
MRSNLLAVALVFAAGCGGGEPAHWKDQPIETVSDTAGGIAFTIDLPKGMTASKVHDADEATYQYHQQNHGEGYTFAPSVSIRKSAKATSLDEAYKSQTEFVSKTTKPPLRKDALADGYLFTVQEEDSKHETYVVELQKAVGAGALTCRARVWEMKRGETVKELVPLVEKMCQSLKVK